MSWLTIIGVFANVTALALTLWIVHRSVASTSLDWMQFELDERVDLAEEAKRVASSSARTLRVLARAVPMIGLLFSTIRLGQGMQPSGLAALAPVIALRSATCDAIALLVAGAAFALVIRAAAGSIDEFARRADRAMRSASERN